MAPVDMELDADSDNDHSIALIVAGDMHPALFPRHVAGFGGLRPGRAPDAHRDFREALIRLEADYLGDSPKYDEGSECHVECSTKLEAR